MTSHVYKHTMPEKLPKGFMLLPWTCGGPRTVTKHEVTNLPRFTHCDAQSLKCCPQCGEETAVVVASLTQSTKMRSKSLGLTKHEGKTCLLDARIRRHLREPHVFCFGVFARPACRSGLEPCCESCAPTVHSSADRKERDKAVETLKTLLESAPHLKFSNHLAQTEGLQKLRSPFRGGRFSMNAVIGP